MDNSQKPSDAYGTKTFSANKEKNKVRIDETQLVTSSQIVSDLKRNASTQMPIGQIDIIFDNVKATISVLSKPSVYSFQNDQDDAHAYDYKTFPEIKIRSMPNVRVCPPKQCCCWDPNVKDSSIKNVESVHKTSSSKANNQNKEALSPKGTFSQSRQDEFPRATSSFRKDDDIEQGEEPSSFGEVNSRHIQEPSYHSQDSKRKIPSNNATSGDLKHEQGDEPIRNALSFSDQQKSAKSIFSQGKPTTSQSDKAKVTETRSVACASSYNEGMSDLLLEEDYLSLKSKDVVNLNLEHYMISPLTPPKTSLTYFSDEEPEATSKPT